MFGRYLRERIPLAIVTLVSGGACSIILRGIGADDSAVTVIWFVLILAALARLALDYLPRRRFWRSVADVTRDLGERDVASVTMLDAAACLEEPAHYDEDLCWQALEAASQAARESLDEAHADSADYRSFVEAWVHEIKTPISAARLIVSNNPGQTSSDIGRELGRIDNYVEQALYYARSGSLDRDYAIREVALTQVVSATLRAHARSLIDSGVAVKTDGLDVPVLTDAKWMAFILGQLVENAAKYVAADRASTLSFSARALDAGRADERVVLDVTDNGIGIPASDLPRVFDKGFVGENGRLEGQAKSTGLGLYLAHRLCGSMGVGIAVDSVRGRGTRVSLTFPSNRMHYVDGLGLR